MNNLDILYYDYMIESVVEDRKIMELSFGAKFSRHFLNESVDECELVVYEGKVIDSILDFIKKIFDKVAEFFNKVSDFILHSFTPNQKLIKACEEKIKSMSIEDRNRFSIENVNITGQIINSINAITDNMTPVKQQLDKVMRNFDNVLDRIDKNNIDYLHDVKSNVEDAEKSLDETLKFDYKGTANDVYFNDLKETLDDYRSSKDQINDFKVTLREINQKMKEYRKKVDRINKNSIVERVMGTHLSMYKDTIYSTTTFITKSTKSILNLMITDFKNQEIILKKFIAFGLNTKTTEE